MPINVSYRQLILPRPHVGAVGVHHERQIEKQPNAKDVTIKPDVHLYHEQFDVMAV